MKKTFTLLMLTLFLSVLAFAQKRERPMPVKHQVPVSLLAKKNPKAALELNKVRTVPLDRQKAVSVSAKKAKKKAPKLAPAAGKQSFPHQAPLRQAETLVMMFTINLSTKFPRMQTGF